MKLGGVTSKLSRNADKIGMLVGVFAGSPSGFEDVLSSVKNLAKGQVHVPNIPVFLDAWLGTYAKQVAMLYILGEALDVVNVPMVSKYAGAIKKGAIGYGAASLGVHALWYSTHSDQGSNPLGNVPALGSGGSGATQTGYGY